jgi:hypothetical protein
MNYKHFHTTNNFMQIVFRSAQVSTNSNLIVCGYFTKVQSHKRSWSTPKRKSYILRTLEMCGQCHLLPSCAVMKCKGTILGHMSLSAWWRYLAPKRIWWENLVLHVFGIYQFPSYYCPTFCRLTLFQSYLFRRTMLQFTSILSPTASCGGVFYPVTFPVHASFVYTYLGTPQQSSHFSTRNCIHLSVYTVPSPKS